MRRKKPLKNRNGYGSVVSFGGRRRRPFGARVTAGFDENGKQLFKYIGYYEKREEAMIALAEFYKKPIDASGLDVTFGQIAEETCRSVENKSKTVRYIVKKVKDTLSELNNIPYRKITILDIEKYKTGQSKDIYFQTFFHHAEAVADAHDIPYHKISNNILAPGYETKERSIFSEEEIEKLWQGLDQECNRIALIYIYTGWRINELLSMPLSDIDLESWTMKGGNKTKAGKNRIVPIHDRIKPLVKEFYDSAEKTLFDRHDEQIRTILKRTGHIPHECRHTFQTRMVNAGVDTITIDKLMGHTGSIGETVYTHKTIEQFRTAINLMK